MICYKYCLVKVCGGAPIFLSSLHLLEDRDFTVTVVYDIHSLLYSPQEKDGGQEVIWFVFQKVKYYYDSEEKKQFNAVQFPVHHSYDYYNKWKGLQTDQQVTTASKRYGANR